jgi:hypothetical protein
MAKSVRNKAGQAVNASVGNPTGGYVGTVIPGYYGTRVPADVHELRMLRAPGLDIPDTDASSPDLVATPAIFEIVNEQDKPTAVADLACTTDESDYIKLTWTNPADTDLLAAAIVRKVGGAMTGWTDPELELVAYLQNIHAGDAMTYYDADVDGNTDVYYVVAIYDNTGHAETVAVVPAMGRRDLKPSAVTDFTASDNEAAQVDLAWTNPSDSDLDEVVVMRQSGALPADHTDGTQVYQDLTPTAGAPDTAADATGDPETPYYYAVFVKDANDHWNDDVAIGANGAIGQRNDAPLLTGVDMTASDDQPNTIDLTWVTPDVDDIAEVVVQRKAGAAQAFADQDDGQRVYRNTSPTKTEAITLADDADTGAVDFSGDPPDGDTVYSYALFAKDDADNWTSAVSYSGGSQNADEGTANMPPRITDFDATEDDPLEMDVSFTPPTPGDLAAVRLIVKTGSYPTGPTDTAGAVLVKDYAVPGDITEGVLKTDTLDSGDGLTDGVQYYCAVFPLDASNYNTAVLAGNRDTGILLDAPPHVTDLAVSKRVTGVTDESIGSGQNISTTLANSPVNPSSVAVDAGGGYSLTDDGAGNLTGTGGSGTITYADGTIAVNWDVDPGVATEVDYDEVSGVEVTWTNPTTAGGDLAEMNLRRATGGFPADHTDGTEVMQDLSPVEGAADSYNDDFDPSADTYYYAIFPKDTGDTWNDTVTDTENAQDITIP